MTEVIDARDDKVYRITKLKDNKCWMLNNLSLDPTDPTTASKMNEQNTNAPNAAITNYLNGGGGTAGWSNTAVSEASTNSFNIPYIDNQYKNTLTPSYGPGATDGYALLGTMYNFCAATVGTYCYTYGQAVDIPNTNIDAPYDVCPANWRLPTVSSGDNHGDYNTLRTNYPIDGATNPDSIQYNFSANEINSLWSSTRDSIYADVIGMLQISANNWMIDSYDETPHRNQKNWVRCLVSD